MLNILDSPEGMGGAAVVLLGGGLKLVTAYLEWRKTRDAKRAMSLVPPSPQLQPPGPAVDAAVLARLDRAEQHDALTTALLRERWTVDQRDRELADARRELAAKTLALELEQAGHGITREQLRARDDLVARLRAELDRARRRRGAVETTSPVHRDASQAGPLQDALRTPIRPPAKTR